VQAAAGTSGLGQQIYREGMLASGEPVQAERDPGLPITGATAACANCHRRSGLGMREGRVSIPPIAGVYLFHARAGTIDDLDLPFVDGMRPDRDPYTDATVARAIRDGVAADGKPLSYLMPHYAFDDAEMAEIIAYLRTLSPGPVPGVTASMLHFATIVTPDADPVKRQGMLDVLEKFFADKNHYVRAEAPRLRSSRRMMFRVNRPWQLHVWELKGAPGTWEAQLRARLAAEPVFAVISGIGGETWAPIQHFCEAAALPCLFPNVDLPVTEKSDFETLYLSGGVLLEAQLIAHELTETHEKVPLRRVIQVFRSTDVGEEAASRLSLALGDEGLHIVARPLRAGAGSRELAAALADIGAGDALVLWLRPNDLATLGPMPARVAAVFMSGRMADMERAPLPASWREPTRMAYPFDLPKQRRVRVDYARGWFSIRQIPVVAEQVQADTYLVCGLVSDAVNHMADTFVPDYLIERIEEMLEHRVVTGYYPRLALAPGQRFASKGGYMVRFADPSGPRIVAVSEWITP
jgi:hypothetical protein